MLGCRFFWEVPQTGEWAVEVLKLSCRGREASELWGEGPLGLWAPGEVRRQEEHGSFVRLLLWLMRCPPRRGDHGLPKLILCG